MSTTAKPRSVARRVNRANDAPVRLGVADAGTRVSPAAFARAVFDEPWRYERVEGRLVVMPPSGDAHVHTSQPLLQYLFEYRLRHPKIVELVVPEAWVRIDPDTDRIPDIGVYLVSKKKQPKIPDRVPDLVFEIVSEGRQDRERDYIHKRGDYHRAGVKQYVIVDRPARKATVLTYRKNAYAETALGPKDTYTTRLLPGLAIPLAEVL